MVGQETLELTPAECQVAVCKSVRDIAEATGGNWVLEMEFGITAMETGLLGLREQRAEAEGMYQQMQDMLRQP